MPQSILMILCTLCAVASASDALFENAPINYNTTAPVDAVANLQKSIVAGKISLTWNEQQGYLPDLLNQLKIPVSSQVLVFSKTSLQRDLISPDRPRAIYFNDNVYIGSVQNSPTLELIATDPNLGLVFYTLDQKKNKRPAFVQQIDNCTQCHAASATEDLPGLLVRSVFPDSNGQPILSLGTFRTNHASPLKQRWGGWYVTGDAGTQKHMGNIFASLHEQPDKTDFHIGPKLSALDKTIDIKNLLAPTSDIVALMVLEHQVMVHNQIVRAQMLTRKALYDEIEMNKILGRPAGFRSPSTTSRIDSACQPLIKALLMVEEAKLSDRILTDSPFIKIYQSTGPADLQILRQFDLQKKLFAQSISPLIQNPQFHSLPPDAIAHIRMRFNKILSGQDDSDDFQTWSPEKRQQINDLLKKIKSPLASR